MLTGASIEGLGNKASLLRPETDAEPSTHDTDNDGASIDPIRGDWRKYIKSTYLEPLSGDKDNKFINSRFRLTGCWRCLYRVAKLPWTAILLVAIAIGLISVFIVFIVNGPSSRSSGGTVEINGTQVVGSTSNLVTIQCETDVSKEECEKRAQDRLSAQDFQQAMSETHLFTTLIVFWLAASIFFCLKAVKKVRRNRYLDALPRAIIPVFGDLVPTALNPSNSQLAAPGVSAKESVLNIPAVNSAVSLSAQSPPPASSPPTNAPVAIRDEVTSYMATKVHVYQELQRSVTLMKYLRYYVENNNSRRPADANWGWRGEWTGVHFPSTIRLASYDYLEARAVAYDASLKIRKDQTVRDWLMMLKTKFTNHELDHSALDALADFYELARFSNESVDESSWYTRMTYAYTVSRSFEEMLQKRQAASASSSSGSPQKRAKSPPVVAPLDLNGTSPMFPAAFSSMKTPVTVAATTKPYGDSSTFNETYVTANSRNEVHTDEDTGTDTRRVNHASTSSSVDSMSSDGAQVVPLDEIIPDDDTTSSASRLLLTPVDEFGSELRKSTSPPGQMLLSNPFNASPGLGSFISSLGSFDTSIQKDSPLLSFIATKPVNSPSGRNGSVLTPSNLDQSLRGNRLFGNNLFRENVQESPVVAPGSFSGKHDDLDDGGDSSAFVRARGESKRLEGSGKGDSFVSARSRTGSF